MGWGGGGKGKGWGGGKGGGGGWGGGGGGAFDMKKMHRRNEQEMLKEAKNQREANYFWEKQQHLGQNGPMKVSHWKLAEEEKELFKDNTGNVGINFDKYDDIPVEMSGGGAEEISPIDSFNDLFNMFQLPQFLRKNVQRCKYSKPTPIQKYAIPTALSGRDAMCCAQTGSGKTCAFLFPILCSIDESEATGAVGIQMGQPAAPKALIMAPTRELCSQIHIEARKFTFGSKVRCSEVYGGVEAKPQLWDLAAGSDLVTATPGRCKDFIDREVMTMSQVGYLVLDEADRMLDMGFEPQIREIVMNRDMPSTQDGRMTLMFSATFPKEIQKLAQAFMRQYIWISVGQVGGAVDTIEQNFMIVEKWGKDKQLMTLLRENPNDTTLVFTAMKRTAAATVDSLNRQGVRAAAIHGDMEQPAREASLSQFRSGKVKVLVATDVAARGLDIPTVSHVINYDLPENCEDYVHRIGRTGRVGRTGWATSFYSCEGNWANHKILRGLIALFTDKGKDVPDALAQVAQMKGMSIKGSGGKGGRFGGSDARGGQVHKFSAWGSGKGGGKSAGNAKGSQPITPGKGGPPKAAAKVAAAKPAAAKVAAAKPATIKPTVVSEKGGAGKGSLGKSLLAGKSPKAAAPALTAGVKRPWGGESGGGAWKKGKW